VGKDVNSSESRGWPLPSTGMGRREEGLSCNVPVQGIKVSPSLSEANDATQNPPAKEQETP